MFSGIVIKGQGVGRKLGFPTANLNCDKSSVHLPVGVYAAWTHFGTERYQSALVVRDNPWKVEVHILKIGRVNLYGKKLSVDPLQKVSTIEIYDSHEELIKKIEEDISIVEDVFNEENYV